MEKEYKVKIGAVLDDNFESVRKTLLDLQNKPIKINIDIKQAQEQLKKLREEAQALSKIRIDFSGNVDEKANETAKAFRQIMDIQRRISSTEIKMAGLDQTKNIRQLQELERILDNLKIESNEAWQSLGGKELSTGQTERYYALLQQTYDKISEINAKKLDVSSVKNAEAEFRKLNDIQNKIASSKSKLTLLDTTKNASEVRAIISELNYLEDTYKKLKTQFSGDLSTEQFRELNSTIEESERKLAILEARMTDMKKKSTATITNNLVDGNYDQQINSLSESINRLKAGGANVSSITTEFNQLKNTLATMKETSDMDELVTESKQYESSLKRVKTAVSQLQKSQDEMNKSQNVLNKATLLYQSMEIWIKRNSKASKEFVDRIREMQEQLELVGANGAEVKKIADNFKILDNEAEINGQKGLSYIDKLKTSFGTLSRYFSSTMVFSLLTTQFRNGTQFVKELDDALTNVSYTMQTTSTGLQNLSNGALDMANDFNTSATTVLQALTLYANANESLDSILEKSETAVSLANVTGMTGTESAETLQSIMNQFDMGQDDLTHISDVMQGISQNMAHDFADGIAQMAIGIEQSGSVAEMAGLSLEEYSSMLGLVIEKTGQSGSVVGNAMKTIISRITSASKGMGTLEEEISNAEESFNAVGIAVRASDGEFRDFGDILYDLSTKWQTMTDVQKSNLSYYAAGTRQTNILKSLVSNYDSYLSLLDSANNSAGVTAQTQAVYADSMAGHLADLSNSAQEFWANFIDSDSAEAFIDVVTLAMDIIAKFTKLFGAIPTALVGLGIVKIIKDFEGFRKTLTFTTNIFKVFFNSMSAGEGIVSSLSTTFGMATSSLSKLSVTLGAVGAVAGIAMFAISALKQKQDEEAESARNAGEEAMSESESLYSLKVAYDNARDAYQNGTGLKSELTTATENLMVALGYEAETVDALADKYDNLNKKVNEYTNKELDRQNTELLSAYNQIKEDLLETVDVDFTGIGNVINYDFMGKGDSVEMAKWLKQQGVNVISSVDNGIGSGTLPLGDNDTVEDAIAIYERLIGIQEELQNGVTNGMYTQDELAGSDILKQVNLRISEMEQSVEKYYEYIDRINKNNSLIELSNLIDSEGLPKTQEQFETFYENLRKEANDNEKYVGSQKDVIESLNEVLAESNSLSGMFEVFSAQEAEETVDNIETVSDKIQTYYDEVLKLHELNDKRTRGNVNLFDRPSIYWDSENLDTYKSELESWGRDIESMQGSFSNLLSGSTGINLDNGLSGELMFTPILDDGTGNGKLLSAQTVSDYIKKVTSGATSVDDILQADRNGFAVNTYNEQGEITGTQFVSGIIQGVAQASPNLVRSVNSALAIDTSTSKKTLAGSMANVIEDALNIESYNLGSGYGDFHRKLYDTLLGYNSADLDKNEYANVLRINMQEIMDIATASLRQTSYSTASADYYSGLIDSLNALYEEAELAGLSIEKLLSHQYANDLGTQLQTLWDSEEFKDTRTDLEELANTAGITATDVEDLASENMTLQEILTSTGMSAEYLATCFEGMIDGATGLDVVTSDALDLNEVLNSMQDEIAEVEEAYNKYKNAIDSGDEYDTDFNNYQEAYEALGEMFENGTYGKNFYRTIEYLYGEGHSTETPEQLYETYKKLGDIFSSDDNGMGFLDKLYDNRDILDSLDSSLSLEGNSYIWDIKEEDFQSIADGLNMTKEEVTACIEALGMFGNANMYDLDTLITKLRGLDMTMQDASGNSVMSFQSLKRTLEDLGLESFEVEQTMKNIADNGFNLIDFNTTGKDNLIEVVKQLETIESFNVSGHDIGLESFISTLQTGFGMTNNEVMSFAYALDDIGYRFVDANGNAQEFNTTVQDTITNASSFSTYKLMNSSFEELSASIEDATSKLNELRDESEEPIKFSFGEGANYEQQIAQAQSIYNRYRTDATQVDGSIDVSVTGYNEAETILIGLIKRKQELSEPAFMSVDTSKFDGDVSNAVSKVQNLQNAFNNLEVANATGIDVESATENLKSALQSVMNDQTVTGVLDVDVTGVNLEGTEEQLNASVDSILGSVSAKLATTDNMIKIGIDETAIEGYEAPDEELNVKAVLDASEVEAFEQATHDLNPYVKYSLDDGGTTAFMNTVVDLNPTITYTYATSGTPPTGATGASPVDGTAFAQGNWGTPNSGVALGGELGQELIVRDGKFFTIGDNSAELFNYKKGDIIFNAEQTKSILETGKATKTNGRGKAFASGTTNRVNPVTGNSYVSSANTNSTAETASETASATADAIETAQESALDRFKNYLSGFYDWIEVKIDRLQSNVDKFINKAETALENQNYSGARTNYRSAINNTVKLLNANQQGRDRYTSQANSVARRAISEGLVSESQMNTIRKRVANGTIDITSYSDEQQEVINSYKEYYDKALDCADATTELKNQLTEYYDALYNIPIQKAQDAIDKLSGSMDVLEAKASAVAGGSNVYDAQVVSDATSAKRSADNAVNKAQSQKNSAQKTITSTSKYLVKNLKGDQKKAVKNGQEVSTEGLKGKALKQAKAYNKALKAKSNASTNLVVAKQQQSVANSAYEEAMSNQYANSSASYTAENMYLQQEIDNSKEQNRVSQNAMKDTTKAVAKAQNTKKSADKNVTKTSAKLLKASGLTSKQQDRIASGKKISTNNLSGNALKQAQAYNKAIDAQTKATKALSSAKKANATATQEAELAQAEYTKTLQDNTKAMFDNIQSSYDSSQSVTEARISKLNTRLSYRDSMGYSRTSDYQKEIYTDSIAENETLLSSQQSELADLEQNLRDNGANMSTEDYNAAQVAIINLQSTILETKGTIADLQTELDNIEVTKLTDEMTRLQNSATNYQNAMSLNETRGVASTANDYKLLIGNSQEQIYNLAEQNRLLEEQQAKYNVGSEKYNELQAQIQSNTNAIADAEESQEKWNQAILNLPITKIEDELNLLDAIKSNLESQISLRQTLGEQLSESDYTEQMSQNNAEIEKQRELYNKYLEYYQKALADADGVYDGHTADYWKQQYLGIDSTINQLYEDNENLKDSLRDDVYWRELEKAHEVIQTLQSELQGIQALIDDNMLFNDDGSFSDMGVAQLGTLVKQYENAREEVQNYQDDINNLNKLYNDGYYTQDEYNTKLNELQSSMLDSASSMKQYTDAIMDMYSTQMQNELDNIFELIDARNELLNKTKEYYDYSRTIQDSADDINSIQAQLSALQGIDTNEANARRKQLEAELKEAQDNMDDTVNDHILELSTSALDDLKETLQDMYDDEIKSMSSDLSKISEYMAMANTLTTQSANAINSSLNSLLNYYGIGSSSGISSNINSYASGTKSAKNENAWTQDGGNEIIVRKSDGAILTKLNTGDGVIPSDLTSNLYKWGDYTPEEFMSALSNNTTGYSSIPMAEAQVNVVTNYENLLNVEGNVDRDALPDLQTILEKSYKYTFEQSAKNLKLAGYKPKY